ncbi:MAG: DUF3795 domain-containing protein [Bacteroidetes bacterium]|nr:DUF3795 domain-containing protein [Bacteroidota bacterium]
MNNLISCCGLNCETCDARIATIRDDDKLRKATAEAWKKMFGAADLPVEAINCLGCRQEGIKFAHCYNCEIRKCAFGKGFQTCGECSEMGSCELVGFVHKHAPEAIANLRGLYSTN